MWVESIITDKVLLDNIINLNSTNPDYLKVNTKELIEEKILKKTFYYSQIYDTLENTEFENNIAYLKLINLGR